MSTAPEPVAVLKTKNAIAPFGRLLFWTFNIIGQRLLSPFEWELVRGYMP